MPQPESTSSYGPNPYSNWQNIDDYATTMPWEQEPVDPMTSWDLNQDGVVNVSDVTTGEQYFGYNQEEMEELANAIMSGNFNQIDVGPMGLGPQLSLLDLESIQNAYASPMEGTVQGYQLQDYGESQFNTAEQALRNAYVEDYDLFQESLATQAYHARSSKKSTERMVAGSGLSTGRQEKMFQYNKEAYVSEIEKVRNQMANKREQLLVDIMGQREGYTDYLSDVYSTWALEHPDEIGDFQIEAAMSCLNQGGAYTASGDCDFSHQDQADVGPDLCGRGTSWCDSLAACITPQTECPEY